MATKTTKKTAKKVEEVKEVLPESPDAADAVVQANADQSILDWIKDAKADRAKEAKDEAAVVVAKKTPDEEFEAEYGKVMRDRDQTGLLSAILKELFLLRTSRG